MAFLHDNDDDVFLTDRYPPHLRSPIIRARTAQRSRLTAAAANVDVYCANSRLVHEHYSRPLYEELGRLLLPTPQTDSIHEGDMEDANARLGVNVESQTQAGLVKVVSALNVCKRCLSSGATDEESRNVTSRMRYMHSWDEPGVEFLTCQRCGHSWKR